MPPGARTLCAHCPRPAVSGSGLQAEAGLCRRTIGCELCFCHELAEGPAARGCCVSRASASPSVARGPPPHCEEHTGRGRGPVPALLTEVSALPLPLPSCRPSFMFRSVRGEPSPTPSQRTPTAATPPQLPLCPPPSSQAPIFGVSSSTQPHASGEMTLGLPVPPAGLPGLSQRIVTGHPSAPLGALERCADRRQGSEAVSLGTAPGLGMFTKLFWGLPKKGSLLSPGLPGPCPASEPFLRERTRLSLQSHLELGLLTATTCLSSRDFSPRELLLVISCS